MTIKTLDKFGALSQDKAKLLDLLLQRTSNRARTIPRFPRGEGTGRSRAPTSGVQQRLWFIDQLEGGSEAYHLQLALKLHGQLDHAAMQGALDALVARHEALRTVFVKVADVLVQEIIPDSHFSLRFEDFTAAAAHEHNAQIMRASHHELAAKFDLSTGPLIRGRLLQLTADEHVLLITMHHIIWDGWSIGVLMRELGALYEARRAGEPDCLPPLPIQYADYAQWQREQLNVPQFQRDLSYWKSHLQCAPGLLELPTDRPRPAMQSYQGATVNISIAADLSADLKALALRLNLTLAMVLHAAWTVLLARLSGQDDVVVGIPVANRQRAELEGLIGFFANTLAVRLRVDDDPSVVQFLRRAKEVLLDAYAHQEVPFESVVEAVHPSRSLSHSPLFQAMFVLQTASRGPMEFAGLTLEELPIPLYTAKFDALLELRESGEGISGFINYAAELFDGATITRWARSFETVLRAMVREPQMAVSRLPLMSEPERREVVALFNATQAPYAAHELLHELIEERVQLQPDTVAVVYEAQSLTYAELNGRANQLAHYLRDRGIWPDQRVGVCIERSLEMVVGLLAILKAGGAYVPIDPNYPRDRLEYMLRDAAPKVLLTQARLVPLLPQTDAEVIALDAAWSRIDGYPVDDVDSRSLGLSPRHLAYVIYTSGSTGQPKGAMNEHRAVINRLQWMQEQYQLGPTDRVLQKTPFSFDVSVWEFFWTLMSGACLIVARPRGHQDPDYLMQLIEQESVTTLHFVPSMLQIFLQQHRPGRCPSLRHIVCSGEELSVALQDKGFECLPGVQLSNLYGPTEAAVDVTFWKCQPGARLSRVPIGRPISNVQMYVLDRHLEPVPIGVAGELYIGGVGVGRGYFNRLELTAERFIRDPFSSDPQARLYKTGDVGRWRADGALEYLGRNDHQVKLRGFRIELGEIEAQLAQHEGVEEAVVIAREDVSGEKRLVAYIVPRDPAAAPSIEPLRSHLKTALPEYMVPSAFVILEWMPLTPNGKLDRRALPAPRLDAYARREHEPPQGEVEEILAGIWQSLLRVERVGRHDNFFELGGHSLLIVQMMEQLRRVDLSTELRRVFDSPTLAALAQVLTSSGTQRVAVPANRIASKCEAITPEMLPLVQLEPHHIELIVRSVPGGARNIQDIYPLAPLQEGILFHHLRDDAAGDTYVLAMLLSVISRQRLQDLIDAFQAVIDRHDVLRTAVLWEQLPQAVQVVHRYAALPVEEVVLDAQPDAAEQVQGWLRPERQRLDVRRAPLMRLRVASDAQTGQLYVLVQLHHMTIDHLALEVMISEAVAHLGGRGQELPSLGQYRDHVAGALTYASRHDAEAFFRAKLGDVDEPTVLFGLTDVHGNGSRSEEAHVELDSALARRIREQARRCAVSAATLFHAAWSMVVAHTSGRDDVVFGTVLLGRLQGGADVQQVVGMFMNTLPLRLQLQCVTAKELVERTQRELVQLLGHEQASLATAQRCSGICGSAPLFNALLNYRHSAQKVMDRWSSVAGIRVLAYQERTNYPVTMSVDDLGEGFALTAQTDRRIDPRRITAYLRVAIQALVDALEQAPHTAALELAVLPNNERRQIVEQFNATRTEYPRDEAIHEVFEECVRRNPAATAVVYEGESLTYEELNGQANKLAHYLLGQGLRPGDYVPVVMSRSLQMLIAELAVLKCGGAYLPLDPELPAERRAFTLRDCGAMLMLVEQAGPVGLQSEEIRCIDCAAVADQIAAQPADDLRVPLIPTSSPAYVMYTSGSTGIPKGVVVPHHAVNRLAINNGFSQIRSDDCIAHYSNPAFDASTFEIWAALLNGARVAIVPQRIVLDASRFAEILLRERVTLLFLTVGLFNQYVDALSEVFPRLRYLLVGGDRLEPTTIRRVLRNCRPQHFLNAYGPTECTTFSTTYLIEDVEDGEASIPIGRPMANAQVYILGSRRQIVPIGVSGELYIGGAGVASGYLNRPDLTTERFIADPFSGDPRASVYKTGDLGRWRSDGTIEFLGRNDHQVKIRGFRIELGEIETRLTEHERVKEAVVLARQDSPGEKRLVAYIVPAYPAAAPSAAELRGHLKESLPEYMLPSAYVVLESLPLSSTGKVARRALPKPEQAAYATELYVPPRGRTEQALEQIWRVLLGVERVGRDDNVFELGAHSLLALKASVAITEALDTTVRVADIYRSPTVRDLAVRISDGTAENEFVDLAREAVLDPQIVARSGLPQIPASKVLLTGATGFVGRFLLAQLLQDTKATVYCLVRASSPREASLRLKAVMAKWDLWSNEIDSRVIAIPGDLRLPRLGIDEPTYRALADNVDVIFHCGTSMNHLETYAMAKAANVDSATALLRLATYGKPKLTNYISTLGVFNGPAPGAVRTVEETSSIDMERHSTVSGYTASKWVGEKIFMLAQERGIPCNIFRLGLVWADAQQGRYDELQREYRLLKTCLQSGLAIQGYRHSMPPTPVDYVARAIVFFAARDSRRGGIFHISSASQMTRGMFERCNEIAGMSLQLVPYYRWICEIKRLHELGQSLPIVPLIEFAFSLEEAAFCEQQRRLDAAGLHIDCVRTQLELDRGGIATPVPSDALLRVCVEALLARDEDLARPITDEYPMMSGGREVGSALNS